MPTERATERARWLAQEYEFHCRYCDRNPDEPRLKCTADYEEAIDAIARAIDTAVEDREAELAQEKEDYEGLVGLLKRRFPPNPDGSLPDFKVEDVLRENEALRANVRLYEEALEKIEDYPNTCPGGSYARDSGPVLIAREALRQGREEEP